MASNDNFNNQGKDWLPVLVLGALVMALVVLVSYLIFYVYFQYIEEKPAPVKIDRPAAKPDEREEVVWDEPTSRPESSPLRTAVDERTESPPPAVHELFREKGMEDVIAFYPLDGNARDVSGNENHGHVYGATVVRDRFENENSAYEFDGVDDYIDIGRPLVSEDFTIAFWFKSNGRQNQFAVPVSQGNMAYQGFSFTFTKNLYNGFSWGTMSQNKKPDPNWGKRIWKTLSFNFPKDIDFDLTWHHLAAVQHGRIVSVFRDGKLQGEISGYPIHHGRFNFNIGRASGNKDFNHRSFRGVIDEVRIYNRALLHDEIERIFRGEESAD